MSMIEQLEQMRMGVDYRFPVQLRAFKVMLRPLSVSEMMECTSNTAQYISQISESQRTRVTEHLYFAKQILVKASTPEVDSNIQPELTDYLLSKMTNEEVQFLYKQYVAITDKCNPILEEMTIEEVKELVDEVKKNPSALIDLSFLDLVNIVRSLLTNVD